MDSTKYSLADFIDIPDQDIMGRARIFAEYAEDSRKRGHAHFRRVSLDGSGPTMRVIDPLTGKVNEMIYMASNDYLNLTKHPRTIAAGRAALDKYGSGAGSVPLLGGTMDIHIELEQKIAKFKGCEDAILYTSGFGSNCGTLLAMLTDKDVAILDLLVHASIIDGCKKTNVQYFRHNNMQSLERALKKAKDKYRTKLVVVDGVYSMDGDIAKLDEIVELAHAYGAYVMVDEAHATGVIGPNGRGTPEHFGLEGKVDIVAGTFSKGLGAVGGFIATNRELVQLLHFYSRSYMFSTAPTPQTVGSLIAALDVIETEPELRAKLWENINYFRENILSLGYDIGNAETAIFPLIIGDGLKVRDMCRRCHELGLYINPVQYPAVPERLSRLRISLMSAHTREHLDRALEILEHVGREFEVI
ncbi:MAG TPA: aminotransferase class I/II-fold pyridoxal phosphate-dependent enzyme [Firmicutes bacterium]|nr:aminotransferase class I/II-fold pyridoxal phosphate-dependent enzyme [Bacillota bacterium]